MKRALSGALLVAGLLARPAGALDKDGKKWLDGVAPIILPDEEKAFRNLKDKADQVEFQKIFWARRNPELESPTNEFKAEYEKARAEADAKFKGLGPAGSNTDCGKVFILLGPPDEIKKDQLTDGGNTAAGALQGPQGLSRRGPETWTFKDRGTIKFKDGQVKIQFDSDCRLPPGGHINEQLTRVAETKIAHPDLDYHPGKDGHVPKLVDLLPKPSPARALLMEPRQDFPITAQTALILKSPGGASYFAGLLRADAQTLNIPESGGKRIVKAIVGAQAMDESGKVVAYKEREVAAEVTDGAFVASYGLALRPGKYTLKVGALIPDGKGGKGSAASLPVELPDYYNGEFATSKVLLFKDMQEGVTPDPQDPYAAFSLGPVRLIPRYGNVFSQKDSLTLLAIIYNPKVNETSGKPSTVATFSILKDGQPLAKGEDQASDSEAPTPSVGPVPLEKFAPGRYVARLKVQDNVAKKEFVEETPFEVKP